MTSKERAQFRAQANTLEPLFQIGKGGFSQALVDQTADALRKRELIKLKVLLDSAPESPREFADKLAEATGSEVIQVVGGSIVLYKEKTEEDEKKKSPPRRASPSQESRQREPPLPSARPPRKKRRGTSTPAKERRNAVKMVKVLQNQNKNSLKFV